MASSGTVIGAWCNNKLTYKMTWEQEKDIGNNRSKINYKVYFINKYSLYLGSRTNQITIDGQNISAYSPDISDSSGHTRLLKSGSVWVNHSRDGTKSFEISGWFDYRGTYSDCGYKDKIYLDTTTVELDSIPRKSVITISKSSYNINDNFTFDCDRKYSGYKQRWKAYVGDFKFYEYITTSTSYSSSILQNPYDVVRRVTTSKVANIKIVLDTLNGNSLIGTDTKWITLNIGNTYPPIVSDLSINEGNSKIANMSLGTNKYLKGYSRINYSATVSGQYNASIVGRPSTTQYDWVNREFSGNKTLTFRDSRGVETVKYVNIQVYDYEQPKIIESQLNRRGTKLEIKLKTNCWDVSNKNPYSVKIYYKESSSSTWTSFKTYSNQYGTKTLNITNTSVSFDVTKSYDVKIRIEDKLNFTESINSISTPDMIMSLGKNGISFGKVMEPADYDGVIFYKKVQVHKPFYMNNNPITMLPDPQYDDHAANKRYVDNKISKPEKHINMDNTYAIWKLKDPQYDDHAANKRYVDNKTEVNVVSNSNGKCYKYADGRMICEKNFYVSSSNWTNSGMLEGNDSIGTWTFPTSFIDEPILVHQPENYIQMIGCDTIYNHKATDIWLYSQRSRGSVNILVKAEGRWK